MSQAQCKQVAVITNFCVPVFPAGHPESTFTGRGRLNTGQDDGQRSVYRPAGAPLSSRTNSRCIELDDVN